MKYKVVSTKLFLLSVRDISCFNELLIIRKIWETKAQFKKDSICLCHLREDETRRKICGKVFIELECTYFCHESLQKYLERKVSKFIQSIRERITRLVEIKFKDEETFSFLENFTQGSIMELV
ncbi:unnamed protein product [Moneuplotes crassus]|uniref:Uncharacterized protein n=1 Tax=Euplotes crassus TaxID=5936 RepID=A0AAD1XMB4_EUPCR|nr:unnamed protein product [Moneuplotes crassus]